MGTRGSASVFIPHVTENYKAPSDAASEDAPDPVCTVRYIPATTEHTVQVGGTPRRLPAWLSPLPQTHFLTATSWLLPPPQWAKGEFDDLFCESAKTINSHPQ